MECKCGNIFTPWFGIDTLCKDCGRWYVKMRIREHKQCSLQTYGFKQQLRYKISAGLVDKYFDRSIIQDHYNKYYVNEY